MPKRAAGEAPQAPAPSLQAAANRAAPVQMQNELTSRMIPTPGRSGLNGAQVQQLQRQQQPDKKLVQSKLLQQPPHQQLPHQQPPPQRSQAQGQGHVAQQTAQQQSFQHQQRIHGQPQAPPLQQNQPGQLPSSVGTAATAVTAQRPKRPREASPGERGGAPDPKPKHHRPARRAPPGGFDTAAALSQLRAELSELQDVEGVSELLEKFPEAVLLGSISARREMVTALLGGGANATSAASALVMEGIKQPLALELRWPEYGTVVDLPNLQKADVDKFLQNMQAATSHLGTRFKVDPLRLRLSLISAANLDLIDLPEKVFADLSEPAPPATQVKIEEMKQRYLGAPGNILVCLEPSMRDLCKHFDPQSRRTLFLGAAAPEGSTDVAAAASTLEQRFATICQERSSQWLAGLDRLEARLTKARTEAKDLERAESADDILSRARQAGISFGRALQEVINGTPGCNEHALTLEEELQEFATAAAKGQCTAGFSLGSAEVAAAAADLFDSFGGVSGYAEYLRQEVRIPGSDVPLNGGAAWNRLLVEVEVAMRLSHPPPEELAMLVIRAIRCGGTGVHGHQRWEDISSKLMLSISYEPLRSRIRYIASRVAWMLRKCKATIVEWMATISAGPSAKFHSPLFPQHLAILRGSTIARDLVFGAYDRAGSRVAEEVLKNLQSTLTAGCINPNLTLRAKTEPDMDPKKLMKPTELQQTKAGRTAEARERVKKEMFIRESHVAEVPDVSKEATPQEVAQTDALEQPKEAMDTDEKVEETALVVRADSKTPPVRGLPVQLCDKVFEPRDVDNAVPHVEVLLRRAFAVLAKVLANQCFAFAENAMSALCRREVDEAMSLIDFTPEQRRSLKAKSDDLRDRVQQVEQRLDAVHRCTVTLRGVRTCGV